VTLPNRSDTLWQHGIELLGGGFLKSWENVAI
jgi:hypothetical protein